MVAFVCLQRIPRYVLLLRELIKLTPATHRQHQPLLCALDGIEQVAAYINARKQQTEQMHAVSVQVALWRCCM